MGRLNGILARVGGILNDNFQRSQMPGGLPGGGMLKLRFDRYIMAAQKVLCFDHVTNWSGGGERAGPRNNGN